MTSQLQKIFDARFVKHQDIADRFGVSRQSISQWVRRGKPSRKYLMDLAAYLDVTPEQLVGIEPFVTAAEMKVKRQTIESRPGWVILAAPERYTRGDEPDPPGEVGVLGSGEFPEDFLRTVAGVSEIRPNQFEIVNILSDTMDPTLRRGGFCIVDTRQTELKHDGLYMIVRHGRSFIRRVHADLDGRLIFSCDNPRYPQDVVIREALNSVSVHGRIVCAFNGQRL